MATKHGNGVLQVIRGLAHKHADDYTPDLELLQRFVEKRDEDAFAVLVRRYGSTVMGVGLRLLHNHQDAEDVCQATFLLLARKADTAPWRDSVGNWLYEVAYRVAQDALKAARRRKLHEGNRKPLPLPDAMADITLRELQGLLDEELTGLPKKYRMPLILCCLEGKARDEVARSLGVPLATVKSRLEEGRELLRRRLAGRGVQLSLALASLTLLAESARAAVPAALVNTTCNAALSILTGEIRSTGVSANVLALFNGGIQTMFLTKIKIAMAALVLAAVAVAAGGLLSQAQAGKPQPPTKAEKPAAGPEAPVPNQKAAGTWKKRAVLLGPVGPATFAAGGKVVVMGSCQAKLWDTLTTQEITTLDIEAERCAYCMEALPGGKTLVTAHRGGLIRLWDATTGKERSRFQAHKEVAHRLAVSPNGKILATAGQDKTVKLWDAATGKELHSLGGHAGNVYAMAFAPDGKTLATAGLENGVLLWDVGTGKKQVTLPLPRDEGQVACLAFSPDGATLASASRSGHLRLWSTATWKERAALKRAAIIGDLRGMAFAPDGKTIACAGTEKGPKGKQVGFVLLWDAVTGKEGTTLEAEVPWPLAVAFSPDGKLLAVAGFANRPPTGEGALQLWGLKR